MRRLLSILLWMVISAIGALSIATIAIGRGESINAMWLVAAALCTYAVGYRFYSKFIAAKVLAVDALRATPAERLEDGRDFVPTNKWVVFGHHFAAIAGPGPLVGPVLAAQFGYLPGTLWIMWARCWAGAVQDFVILFCLDAAGREVADGRWLKEEVGTGRRDDRRCWRCSRSWSSCSAVVALVVVNALKGSPWGTFTIAMTIPIAMLMGVLSAAACAPGKVLETSALGICAA